MPNLCSGTPKIVVADNRGLTVRILQYNRSIAGGPLDERITRNTYDVLGHTASQIDPRFFTALQTDATIHPNLQSRASLRGKVLRDTSVDAGDTVALFDVAGRKIWHQDGRGTQLSRTYDTLGRVSAVHEQTATQTAPVCSEWLIYLDTATDASGAGLVANQRGQLVRHYDTGGLLEVTSYSLQGPMTSQTRQLLADLDTPADWSASDEAGLQAALTGEPYTTAWHYDAQGAVLAQTDARGNRQRKALNVAGQVQSTFLLLAAAAEQTILSSVSYSAAGQPLSKTAGNRVVTTYAYEQQTQRLVGMTSKKPDGTLLQNLRYTYDPVGNLLNINDASQPIVFYKNQAVSASRQYTYDALYQLLSATGRENDNAGRQGPTLPGPLTDPQQLVPYTRRYTYDRGGNLTQIQHQGSASYNNQIVVSNRSNHGVAQTATNTLPPTDIDTWPYFDACGNSLQQTPGRTLTWNTRNQLLTAVTVDRGGDPSQDDCESYGYDATGTRLWKNSLSRTSGPLRRQQVIYLPGLELRTTASDATLVETLEVIVASPLGHVALRLLHWALGQPGNIPNNQYRYSLDDQIGSVNLEFDGQAALITAEEFYPYGGTAVWGGSESEVKYKFIRYSGKERDATGLYYYGFRYYMPWLGRWLNADPTGTVDGLNLYRMVQNCPVSNYDTQGAAARHFNMNSSTTKEVVVSRVEVAEFNARYSHIMIPEQGAPFVYTPAPRNNGNAPEANLVSLTRYSSSPKNGMSVYEKSRLFLANSAGNTPRRTLGWLGFNSPQRTLELYEQKEHNEGDRFEFVIKTFRIPAGVYKAIAETAKTEASRSPRTPREQAMTLETRKNELKRFPLLTLKFTIRTRRTSMRLSMSM